MSGGRVIATVCARGGSKGNTKRKFSVLKKKFRKLNINYIVRFAKMY